MGTALDVGHRFSDKPAKGEGLADAVEKMLASLSGPPKPVQRTFASLNGESFGSKEWGVARIRHAPLFAPASEIEHPADCFGDAGAASGALLLALAQHYLMQRQMQGPMLVWASATAPTPLALISIFCRDRGSRRRTCPVPFLRTCAASLTPAAAE